MTRAFCQLIIHFSTICLSWRSIKALQQQSREKNALSAAVAGKDENNAQNITTTNNVLIMDMEILQLWALYALHKIYVELGVEYIVSYIPFYYYIKMLVLLATVIPRTKVPSLWFTTVLVPMMKKCHEMLNVDWGEIIWREIVLLPWRILDITIIPGVLGSHGSHEEELKMLRRDQLLRSFSEEPQQQETFTDNVDVNTIENENSRLKPREKRLKSKYTSMNNTPPSSQHQSKHRRRKQTNSEGSVRSPIARSRVAASSLHLRKFSREHTDTQSEQQEQEAFSASRRRTSTSVRRNNHLSPHKSSIASRPSNMEDKGSTPPRRYRTSRTSSTPTRTPPTRRKKIQKSSGFKKSKSIQSFINESPSPNNDKKNENKKKGRKSLNQQLRNFIIGDSNIRLRDYLFDLNLPSLPPTPRSTTTTMSSKLDCDNDGFSIKRSVAGDLLRRVVGWKSSTSVAPTSSPEQPKSADRHRHRQENADGIYNSRNRRRTTIGTFQRSSINIANSGKNDSVQEGKAQIGKDGVSSRSKLGGKGRKNEPNKTKRRKTVMDEARGNNVTLRRSRRIASVSKN